MGILRDMKNRGYTWLGNVLSRGTRAETEITREKVKTLIAAGRAWFMPYVDSATGETEGMRREYRRMLRDATVKAGLYSKILAVSSLDLTVQPDGIGPKAKKAARWVRWNLERGGVAGLVAGILSGGCMMGHSLGEKVWRRVEGLEHGGSEFVGNIGLRALKQKDPDTYRLKVDEFNTVTEVSPVRPGPGETSYAPTNFVLWRHLPLYEGLGQADFRAAYRPYWILDTAWKLRAIRLEKFGNPLLWGKYASTTDKPGLDQALRDAASQTWMSTPDGVMIEAIQLAGSGPDIFREAILDLRHEIMLAITGAILQALEGAQTGARSIGEVHQSSAELLVWYLAESVAEALNRQLVPDMMALNYVGAGCPLIGLSGANDSDLLPSAQLDSTLLSNGMKLSKSEAYKRYRRSEPDGPDDAWEAAPAPTFPFTDKPAAGPGGPAPVPFPPAKEEFDDDPGDDPNVAIPGDDGRQVESLLADASRHGVQVLHEIGKSSVRRLLKGGAAAALKSRDLFTADEREQLADALAATTGTADLMGRSRIRSRMEKLAAGERKFSERLSLYRFDEAGTPAPASVLSPEQALEFFRKLTPTIGVDPQRWGPRMRRQAFTLAVDTEGVVLDKVKSIIAERLETGQGISTAPAAIDEVLEAAGISPKQPHYSELVFRTNYQDSIQAGIDEEKSDPEIQSFFPVWQYSNPDDSRSRPAHAARNGLYYPIEASFAEVRGTDASDVIQCRCDQILIDKFEWADLVEKGARVQTSW